MPADFPNFDAPNLPRPSVRQPIDYRSRNAKLRLFGIVAALILVLAVAEKLRDPASWNWLLGRQNKTEQMEKPINNRLARAEAGPSEPETVFLNQGTEKVLSEKPAEEKGPTEQSWKSAWRSVWRDLGSDERSLLFRLVEAAQDDKQFSAESSSRAQKSLETIDGLWTAHQSAAFQEITELPVSEQKPWEQTLREVNARWSKELRPSLQLVALGGNPSTAERTTIAEFQRDIEQLCLVEVRDDATFLRPDENQIWFHLMHELQAHSPADLKAKSAGIVGYNAMYNQPEAYRGKVVTVKAQVRWAYRVPAIKNYLGIKEFNVLYLAPEGVPDKPLIVYSLGLPAGFPRLKEQNHPSGMTAMHEDVVVTGFFFKRGAYRGKDANYTAPLILANVPAWIPPEGPLVTSARGQKIWWESLTVAAVLFAVAAIVVYFVSRRGRGADPRPAAEQSLAGVAELQQADPPEGLQDSLKRLAKEMPDGK
ncbi:MAG: hypothetical protein IAF94_03735 [Pirellulaceae bacterium]|nr:hypothetical protein [Pirellulaceae bacterium]